MSRIIPKLNLNKTPQLVENNSLIMAKNIRLLEDGTIGPDTSLKEVETKSGDSHEYVIHHDAVIEEKTNYEYTILDYQSTISVIRDGNTLNPESIGDNAFDFNEYGNEQQGEEPGPNRFKYVRMYPEYPCHIHCYKHFIEDLELVQERFTYSTNHNALITSSGYWLFIAIREQIYNNTQEPINDLKRFYYVILPQSYNNFVNGNPQTINIRKFNYVVLNPVYQTSTVEQVVIHEAYDEHVTEYTTPKYLGQIVGLDNKIYFFREDIAIQYSQEARGAIGKKYPTECFAWETPSQGQIKTFDVNSENYITRKGELFEDREIAESLSTDFNNRARIIEYDEVEETFTRVKCAWHYSGGKINGCVFKNNTGHTILTVCEYDVPNGVQVPIKHIDLNICKLSDNESIYTQNPNIPVTNLILSGEYPATIPAGVYQFFIRYKIDNNNRYTNWFPCSKEYFTGSKKTVSTIQGELKYIDKHSDSDKSFIFSVQHLYPNLCNIYKKYQIGFILSNSDGGIVAREWKEFDFGINTIYFDYLKTDIKDANIDDLLETSYELFNVENCVNYKNKLYIANYEETDFNPNLFSLAKQVQIYLNAHTIGSNQVGTFFDNELLISSTNNNNFDYIGEYGIPINIKWANSNYFIIPTPIIQTTDITGYFSSFDELLHRHIENSNVDVGDYIDVNGHHSYSWASEPFEDEEEPFQNYGYYNLPQRWVNSVIDNDHYYDYNKAHILAIYVKSGNNYIQLSTDFRDNHDLGYYSGPINSCQNNNVAIGNYCDSLITGRISYYSTSDNKWYVKGLDDNYYPIDDYYIVYCTMDKISDEVKQPPYYGYKSNNVQYNPEFTIVTTKKTIHILKRTLIFDTSVVVNYSNDNKEYPTLLPYTNYNFYIHYVKANGVITNGYLINDTPLCTNYYGKDSNQEYGIIENVHYYVPGTKITTQDEDDIILYPSFDNILKPDGYVGCFISIAKVGNNVCQLFNVEYENSGKEVHYKADCLELDTLCYTKFNNISIYNSWNQKISDNGKYYDSGNVEDINYFGECGSVVWTTNNIIETIQGVQDDIFWIVINTNESAKRLIKFTPFIKLDSIPIGYNNYEDINNIGFTCHVKKLKKKVYSSSLYINGNDIYTISRNDPGNGSNATLELTETTNLQHFMLIRDNKLNRIKSNFNLNYMNLSNDIVAKSKTIYNGGGSTTRLICTVDSLISSFIYEFNSWYKEYTRKQYSIFELNKLTRFDNTIRSSRVINDEEYNTFKFDSTDYYNVPSLRGIITNLISIANSIYVHCEHSLFKFSDNKTLNAESEEVTLQENDIFNSGITEVFDAQYGYAGLKKREQSLITYNAYIFYDEVAKTVYAFGGEQQIGNISEPIKKLIKAINPTDVQFLGDEPHNRFFINFRNNLGNVCISFNFNSKSFVSVHDIDFKFGFHSRRHSYVVRENIYDNQVTGWSIYKIIDVLRTELIRSDQPMPPDPSSFTYVNNYIAYQNCYKKSLIHIADCDDNTLLNEVNSANACVDIICNTEYELIKVLNYISWICSEIQQYGEFNNNVSEEIIDRHYPGHKIRIYTDSTETSLFELLDSNGNPKIANENTQYFDNEHQRANSRAWQYPQYNCGVWSMNYFRDVKNIEDIFNYKNPDNKIIGETGHETTVDITPKITRLNLTQESSLLYGKYFVVRFIFNNKNFKLENVILRMNDYGKTK